MFAFAVTLMIWPITSFVCADESPPPPSEAQALADRLVDWKNSFHNLHVMYRMNNPREWIRRKPELAAPGALDGYYHTEDWLYSDDGRSRVELRGYENGVLVSRRVYGNDREHVFAGIFKSDTEVPDSLHTGPIRPGYQPNQGANYPVATLHLHGTQWFGESVHQWEVARYEDLDGVRCAVVQPPNSRNSEHFFDLEHDGLIRLRKSGGMGSPEECRVDEFRQLNHGRWFPWRGSTSYPNDRYEWEVLEAEVNLELTDADFAPPAPGPFTIHSGFEADTSPLQSAPKVTPPTPAPLNRSWPWGVVGIILVGLLAASGFYLRTISRSRVQLGDIDEPPPLPRSVAVFAPWTWPRWNRWVLVGAPALLVTYVLSIGPMLLFDQFVLRGSWAKPVTRIYYPLLAISEEISPWQSALDRYCQMWSPGRWIGMKSYYRTLKLEGRMRADELNTQLVTLAAVLTVGLTVHFWRKRTIARRSSPQVDSGASLLENENSPTLG